LICLSSPTIYILQNLFSIQPDIACSMQVCCIFSRSIAIVLL